MSLSPIIERELRVSARQWRTYYSRVFVGLWALALCMYVIILVGAVLGGAAVGSQILRAASMLGLALCLFNGVNRTCDSISSEKREDTLGLLFLTHLRGYDIVIGKLLANGIRAVYQLMAITPILAIPIFLGGVAGGELLRVPMVLLNSLFLSLSIGLLVSSIARSQRTAHSLASTFMVVLGIGLPAGAYLVQRYANAPGLALALNLPSPTYTLGMAADSAIGLTTNLFWTAFAIQFAIACTALIAACLITPHSWQTKASNRRPLKDYLLQLAYGDMLKRTQRRVQMLKRSPICWLNCRDRFAPLWPLLFGVVSLGIALGCIKYFGISGDSVFVILFGTLAVNDFAMRIRVGSIASLQLGTDRQSGALEMILSTPITVREIVSGIWSSIRKTLLWTYVPLLLVYALTVVVFIGPSWEARHWFVAGFFVVFSIFDFIAMGYLAMWNGMRMRNVQHAAGHTLLRVLILPWTLWSVLVPLMQEARLLRNLIEFGSFGFLVAGIAIWSVSTGRAILSARRNLFAHFREAATDRYMFDQRTSLSVAARRCLKAFRTPSLLERPQGSLMDVP